MRGHSKKYFDEKVAWMIKYSGCDKIEYDSLTPKEVNNIIVEIDKMQVAIAQLMMTD